MSLREFFAVNAIGSTLFASVYVLFPGALIAPAIYLIITFFIVGPVLFKAGIISLDTFLKTYEDWEHQARLKEIASRKTPTQPTQPTLERPEVGGTLKAEMKRIAQVSAEEMINTDSEEITSAQEARTLKEAFKKA